MSPLAALRSWSEEHNAYRVRLARNADDLRAVQSLRFEVFSRELGARVLGAEQGLDLDPIDEHADHLMVIERATDECVGSYRLATRERVEPAPGFYTHRIFDLSALDADVLTEGVELGRACVGLRHRTRGVFQLLLRGIGAYLVATGKRYLFGCGSVPLKDPGQASLAIRQLEDEGWLDALLDVEPTPRHLLPGSEVATGASPEIPALIHAYHTLGARLAARPAYDPDFHSLDFFVLLDLDSVEPRVYARYCAPR